MTRAVSGGSTRCGWFTCSFRRRSRPSRRSRHDTCRSRGRPTPSARQRSVVRRWLGWTTASSSSARSTSSASSSARTRSVSSKRFAERSRATSKGPLLPVKSTNGHRRRPEPSNACCSRSPGATTSSSWTSTCRKCRSDGVDRRHRRGGLAAPAEGLGLPSPRRWVRHAGDRHSLFRQPRLHGRRELLWSTPAWCPSRVAKGCIHRRRCGPSLMSMWLRLRCDVSRAIRPCVRNCRPLDGARCGGAAVDGQTGRLVAQLLELDGRSET